MTRVGLRGGFSEVSVSAAGAGPGFGFGFGFGLGHGADGRKRAKKERNGAPGDYIRGVTGKPGRSTPPGSGRSYWCRRRAGDKHRGRGVSKRAGGVQGGQVDWRVGGRPRTLGRKESQPRWVCALVVLTKRGKEERDRKQCCFRQLAPIGVVSGFRAVQGRRSRQIIVSWEDSDASSISRLNKRVESRRT